MIIAIWKPLLSDPNYQHVLYSILVVSLWTPFDMLGNTKEGRHRCYISGLMPSVDINILTWKQKQLGKSPLWPADAQRALFIQCNSLLCETGAVYISETQTHTELQRVHWMRVINQVHRSWYRSYMQMHKYDGYGINQWINQTSIVPISPAKPGSVQFDKKLAIAGKHHGTQNRNFEASVSGIEYIVWIESLIA